MKKLSLKPGFEFIFAFSMAAILGLPPLLLAQNQQEQKDLDIRIENGDTTINGKNIKGLSARERQEALKDIRHLSSDVTINPDGNSANTHQSFTFKRRGNPATKLERVEIRKRATGDSVQFKVMADENFMFNDSTGKVLVGRPHRPGDKERDFAFRFKNDGQGGDNGSDRSNFRMRRPMMAFNRRNTQHFDYNNVGSDGISTHISFEVSDGAAGHNEADTKATLALTDLSLVPEFTTGKTMLMFHLPAKGTADVKFTDNEGKTLWTERVSLGSFSKKINLPLNGVYYLHVKQGSNTAEKRIVKDE